MPGMDRQAPDQTPSGFPAGRDRDGGAGSAGSHAELAHYFFGVSAEAARAEFDPVERWEEFVEALWEQVDAGFGLTVDEGDFPDVPRAWFDRPDDSPLAAWEDERG